MLELVSFICGASVMVMEMAGSRLLAPHLGTSIVVWTALIGVILASLSAGYWLGGKAGDRNPNAGTLSRIILAAAAFVLLAAFLQQGLLPSLTRLPLEAAAIIAAALLFTIPSVLLGMVSPYIIQVKLARIRSKDKSGSVIGRFYAVSTIGSILGTFLGGYFLISWFGTRTILYAVAAALALAALPAAMQGGRKAGGKGAAPMALLFLLSLGGGSYGATCQIRDPTVAYYHSSR
jgi:MFS family permease